jgi:mannose/fructose/N-acetylgalactosamine-specific phosphotransferase system component IIB
MTQGTHVRIDNRLLHGQVVQFWIPSLEVQRLVIADEATAADRTLVSLYRMVMPKSVTLDVVAPAGLGQALADGGASNTLVLLGNVADAIRARKSGFAFDRLTIGNVQASGGRSRVTDSVYLSEEEVRSLLDLRREGATVDIQSFPGEQFRLELDDRGGPVWVKR